VTKSNAYVLVGKAEAPRLAIFAPEVAASEPVAAKKEVRASRRLPDTRSDTRSRKPKRPEKPREDFPLFPHASGRWAKKVRGNLCYFGKWSDDPKGERALNQWLDEKDDLLAGRKPRPKGEAAGPTVKYVCDAFLTRKEQQRDNGEIQPRTFDDLKSACTRVADTFGRERLVSDLRPDDFAALRKELARTRGPVALGIEIQKIRSVFKFAFDDGIIDAPVRLGTGFKKPSAKVLRIERAKKGARDLPADQIRALIEVAGIPLKAMILLAVNCGFGNHDCGSLPLSAIDLEGGWISYARPKTGVSRRAKLWPETVEALHAAIDKRPQHRDRAHSDVCFITKYGTPWAKGEAGNDPVGLMFKKALKELKLHRDGIGFYSLRRTFETIAGDTLDQPAVDVIMGHAPAQNDMAAVYRQRVNDERLVAVAEHVRRWLFPAKPKAK
jgi:integrase